MFNQREEIESVLETCARHKLLHACNHDCSKCVYDIDRFMAVGENDKFLLEQYSMRNAKKALDAFLNKWAMLIVGAILIGVILFNI